MDGRNDQRMSTDVRLPTTPASPHHAGLLLDNTHVMWEMRKKTGPETAARCVARTACGESHKTAHVVPKRRYLMSSLLAKMCSRLPHQNESVH